jgi:competence protein ComEA
MRIWLNKHFGFSKGEFNGLLFLIIIILLLKSATMVYSYFKPADVADQNLLNSIEKITISDEKNQYYVKDDIEDATEKTAIKLFKFDPNKIDLQTWKSFGLSEKQAQSIINYRSKGGKFYKVEDLQKMYTISPAIYKKLLPFVEIENQNNYSKTYIPYEKKEYVKKALVIVEINQADSAQLDQIKGIGPAFATRILKYRERLGGFYKKEQLMEVYGLDSLKYDEIKNQISINPAALKTININTADFNALKGSPYLSYKQINAIIQYRKQHGSYSSANDLKKILILTPQVIEKIAPYISF